MSWIEAYHTLVSLFAHPLLLFLIILNSLFTDLLHFSSIFKHGFIQLIFHVMNQINIINQVTWTNIITIIIVVEIWSGYTVCYVDMKCIIILPYSIKTKENDIVNERKWYSENGKKHHWTMLTVCVCVFWSYLVITVNLRFWFAWKFTV